MNSNWCSLSCNLQSAYAEQNRCVNAIEKCFAFAVTHLSVSTVCSTWIYI